ncbi:chloramphenicol phosphotransferase CPT family protein [Hyphomonas sp. NPDC076900]|uniref:chloramphenicol phosphotransferase CPT family protein n=1 Tax=unclassified Hyphomonas TaxID=2630699 RepID=UPI003D016B0A
MPAIVVLNGTSSAGKSSLARALQQAAARNFLHVQMDAFLGMQPPRLNNHPDAFVFLPVEGADPPEIAIETGDFCQQLLDGMRRSVKALADAGLDLVVDDVWLQGNEQHAYEALLREHTVHFVGVYASLEACEVRERARGDRDLGQARWQHARVHVNARYDLEVDTTETTPEKAAEIIAKRFEL